MSEKTKILIVDDTAIYRKILSTAIEAIPGTEVVGKAHNGVDALKKLETLEADLVLLDVVMPEMDGLETLGIIQEKYPNICVVMISGEAENVAESTFQALKKGALDFIPKPQTKSLEEGKNIISTELKRILKLVESRSIRKHISRPRTPSSFTETTTVNKTPKTLKAQFQNGFDLLLIGSSTGGPNALNVVLSSLPKDLGCPVLLVQHMPPVFTKSMAQHLDKECEIKVQEAEDNMPVLKNAVLVAPGGKHMVIKNDPITGELKVRMNEDPHVNSCRPAVDVLFQSATENFKGKILSVILTGMGDDGANGVQSLKNNSSYCLAQDENTCVVYGMPKAIVDRKLADEILPLNEIGNRITSLVKGNLCLT